MFGNNSIVISGNRGHGFEGEWEGVYGRVWREKRGGRNVTITLKYQKQKKGRAQLSSNKIQKANKTLNIQVSNLLINNKSFW